MTATAAPVDGRPRLPEALLATRVVAILRRIALGDLGELVDALVAGGIRCVEVTVDSEGALSAIAALRERVPEGVAVGAGTVLDLATAESALAAGATFLVAPNTDPALVGAMAGRGVPMVPGAFTASEVLGAWRAGAAAVKVFPSQPVGPGYIRDLRGPLPFIPMVSTGGITLESAPAFVAAGAAAVGLGGPLGDLALLRREGAGALAARARALLDSVAAAAV